MSNTYGYVRVSSKDQNEDRQLIVMREFGVMDVNVFRDKQSGKDFERPAYKALLSAIRPADTIVIKSIDRLGRDYEEIIEQWRVITKDKQVAGYAAVRYSSRPRPDRHIYCRFGSADSELRRTDRARIQSTETG